MCLLVLHMWCRLGKVPRHQKNSFHSGSLHMIYVEWVFFACSSIVLLLFGLVSFLILTKMLDFLFVCIIYTFYIKCRYMEENGHSRNNIRASHNIGRLGSLVRVTNFGLCCFFLFFSQSLLFLLPTTPPSLSMGGAP